MRGIALGRAVLPFFVVVSLVASSDISGGGRSGIQPGNLQPAGIQAAQDLYRRADYKASLDVLRSAQAQGAEVWELMGKNWFMLGDFKKACDAFEKGFQMDSGNSSYALWLGRAYGRKAESATPLLAGPTAAKARRYFEKAVELDPKNQEALQDLFDYYLQAPAILGGGRNKAVAIASRIEALNPADYHLAQAELADQDKRYETAEQQLRRAWEVAPHQVSRAIDLAKYLAKRGRYQESEATFRKAEEIAPGSPQILFAHASAYVESKRNLDQAKKLIEKYLQSNLTPDDPPREDARKLLKKVEDSGV